MVITILFVKTSDQLSFINGLNSVLYHVSIKQILMKMEWWDFYRQNRAEKHTF